MVPVNRVRKWLETMAKTTKQAATEPKGELHVSHNAFVAAVNALQEAGLSKVAIAAMLGFQDGSRLAQLILGKSYPSDDDSLQRYAYSLAAKASDFMRGKYTQDPHAFESKTTPLSNKVLELSHSPLLKQRLIEFLDSQYTELLRQKSDR